MYGGIIMKELDESKHSHAREGSSPKRGRRARVPPLLPQERGGTAPLSYAQERLWFLDQLGLVGAAYNMTASLRLQGGLNVAALQRSLAEIVRRHESLRTRFESRAGSPLQVIDPPGSFMLDFLDLTALTTDEQALAVQRLTAEETQRPCDLVRGPLLRARLLKQSDQEHLLLLTAHHIAFDGWSRAILHRELRALYAAYCRGEQSPLQDLPLQYADFSVWQRNWLQGEALQEHLRYWREQLLGAPPQLELPTDRPRPPVESFKGALFNFELPPKVAEALKDLARREGATLFMVALAAYQLLLARWSGQNDIVVGSPTAGRAKRELEGLIGFFVNILALRTQVSDELTFRQILQHVKKVALDAYAHEDLPFELLVKELRPERNLTRQPVFQVVLALRNFPEERLELSGLTWTWGGIEAGTTHFDLTLFLREHVGGLSGMFEYATDLFDEATISRLSQHFEVLLESIVADPDRPVWQLQLLTHAEREQLLHEFNATSAPGASDRLVHELFEARARHNPDATAVVCGDQQLTYSQLNRRANLVARALLSHGLRPDGCVGLFLERSVDVVVGMLGILKAGGAYVPLDVTYPAERLAYMVRDSAPVALLTHSSLKGRVPLTEAAVIAIDADCQDAGGRCIENIQIAGVGLNASHLAYVIYTSGSTGTPKGVMIEHGHLLNLINWHCTVFQVTESSRCSSLATVGFDAATWEIWPPLTAGGTVLLAPPETVGNTDALLTWWADQSLDVSFLPTPLAELAFTRGISNEMLRTLLIGGDRLRHRPVNAPFALVNNYGPTESTVVATSGLIAPDDQVLHIGRPIANTRVYILDPHRQLVPIGVLGELYIAGANVARGYLNRPELTMERFTTDPFDAQSRMYRTGDLGRWRADGTIDYVGRNDQQVKIRGYRIELGEIETQLLKHQHVKEAVVLAPEDGAGERRLTAYVVADSSQLTSVRAEASDAGGEMVNQWEGLYDDTYSAGPVGPSFVGWNSSYSGKAIPEAEMEEWLAYTVQRIRGLQPDRVLEIGCGVGLLVQHLAPRCSEYVGADFSASALAQLRQWMSGRAGFEHVKLLHRSATELDDLPANSFDTVILNSVVQYFPNVGYLVTVLQEALRLLRPGGRIFLGDVRHLGSLEMFHCAVQLGKATETVSIGQLKRRIARAIEQDKELVIAPQLFAALPAHLPGISTVQVHLKQGRASNELTLHRYDVMLHTQPTDADLVASETLMWGTGLCSVDELYELIATASRRIIHVVAIPNARLVREVAAHSLMGTSDERLGVDQLRHRLDEVHLDGVDPEQIRRWAESQGCYCILTPADAGCFDMTLVPRELAQDSWQIASPCTQSTAMQQKPLATYANNPLESSFRQQLIPMLREYLSTRLPEYMLPSAWVVLKQLPLTPNGKLDRGALPASQGRAEELGEYVAPRNHVERTLADIWAEVLRVDQPGVRDNFFDLGGHSLLAVKMLYAVNQAVAGSLALTDVYRSPTIQDLAARIVDGAGADDPVELAAEAALDQPIVPHEGAPRVPPRAMLLTGATGFVGRFLLAQLLEDTQAVIYCLVRANSTAEATLRLRETLQRWDLWRDEHAARIVAIAGDLRRPRLGAEDDDYQMLCERVDCIYHCATSMNHLETYPMAKAANVDSAKELMRIATRHVPKVINYVSTLGVFGPHSDTTTPRIVHERNSIDGEMHRMSRGYVASKWVGEKIFMSANERGIACNIFRLGLVWGDTRQGRFDELQNAYRLLKSCLLSGVGIERYSYAMVPTPVDCVARAIVFLSGRHSAGGGIFHISAAGSELEGVFERCNEVAGTALQLVPHYDWVCRMKRLQQQGVPLPVIPEVESAAAMDEESFYELQRRARAQRTRVDCSRTQRELAEADIFLPALDDELLRRCVEAMRGRDVQLRGLTAPAMEHSPLMRQKRLASGQVV
jgi:amino acid adenylation domain-containing protein/thioester reductase-like protein